jgi:GNAT superfamily N-acetyltransferase
MTPRTRLIRTLERGDLPVLQGIRRAAFAPVFASFRSIVGDRIAALALADADAEQARLLDDICAPNSGQTVLVVEVEGVTVGFVSYSIDAAKRTGEIGLNAVHPDSAGMGIGAWMYDYVLAQMRELGMVLAVVGTGGDDSHAPARRAYEKVGFGPAIPSVYLYKLL